MSGGRTDGRMSGGRTDGRMSGGRTDGRMSGGRTDGRMSGGRTDGRTNIINSCETCFPSHIRVLSKRIKRGYDLENTFHKNL